MRFLYIPDWEPPCESRSDFLTLADIYAMGERLMAKLFQEVVLRTFIANIKNYKLENAELCRLLIVVCTAITESRNPEDDPM
jgi:hypothetical protein